MPSLLMSVDFLPVTNIIRIKILKISPRDIYLNVYLKGKLTEFGPHAKE